MAGSSIDGDVRDERAGRRRVAAVAVALLLGVLASGVLVVQGTQAAFTATTSNAGNSWTAGSVGLVNDASGTAATGAALFSVSGLLPSTSASAGQENCLEVGYTGVTGGVAAPVRLYAAAVGDASGLAAHIHLTVTEGSGGSSGFGDCTGWAAAGAPIYDGTLAGFNAKLTHADGVGTWAPTAAGTTVYKFQYYLDSALAVNGDQGRTTTTTFTWEARAGI